MATAHIPLYRSKGAVPVILSDVNTSPAPTEDHPVVASIGPARVVPVKSPGQPLNRLREVREQQGVSTRTVSRHLQLDAAQVRQQEQPTADLKLSDLYRWQAILDVPVANLLVEDSDPLSPAIAQRAKLVRIMKTVMAMAEDPSSAGVKTFITNLLDQLVDLMPELREVGAWPSVGQRRTADEQGRIMQQPVSSRLFASFDAAE